VDILVGLPISLTGPYAHQGRQILQALRLWEAWQEAAGGLLGRAVRLVVRDDQGRVAGVRQACADLLDRGVEALLGPYGSHLTRAALEVARARGRLLWNHGGASDDIAGPCVQVLSPASHYFRRLPAWIARHHPEVRRLTVLRAARGSFPAQVARGLVEAASQEVEVRVLSDPAPDARAVVLAAGFDDEVAWIRRHRPPLLAAVSAGVARFGAVLGERAEGVVGPSPWEPHPEPVDLGPTCQEFLAAWPGPPPDYPAVAAFATGLILTECARRAGTLEEEALYRQALGLRLRTLYGGFALDAAGRQVGHTVHLVQWQGGVKRLVAP
jgi:branched-chain amino acid transport system substrate-binding protein